MAFKWAKPKKRSLRWYEVYVMDGKGAIYRSYRGGCWVVRVRAVSMKQARFYLKRGVIAASERDRGIVDFKSSHTVRSGSQWPWPDVDLAQEEER